ncbi:uncharacterized protein LOC131164535 isoform X1 [Malania oleifera]|uniref:uncharacterized protein LOC131164535 isoform X1 n=1 Tax=Malania oleifera TaxID=397392 RepID=UPI0025ADF72E|nr:uncharacterized protein LOC131164535 isoform X1 [Malania oleifera]
MSATIISDPMVVSAQEAQPTATTKLGSMQAQIEVEFAKCECCPFTEECTPAYIQRVRERYQGRWICGLCAEAVKDEIVRSKRLISTEEALNRHISFCKKFNSSTPPPNPTVHLISAMRQLLRRSLDSPRALRSTPASPMSKGPEIPRPALTRSESCFPTLSG